MKIKDKYLIFLIMKYDIMFTFYLWKNKKTLFDSLSNFEIGDLLWNDTLELFPAKYHAKNLTQSQTEEEIRNLIWTQMFFFLTDPGINWIIQMNLCECVWC